MKRRGWVILVGALLASAAVAALLRPRPAEKFPLAELVPPDALFYAGFQDFRQLESLETPWSREILRRLEPARPHLSGAVAVYLDPKFRWVALARLTRPSALLAGTEVDQGAAVSAQTPEALARHKARQGSLSELPEFRSLGTPFFFNLEEFRFHGRFRDFSAVGFEITSTSPLGISGRALYRGGLFRTYLEQYVHAPRHGAPEGSAPFQAALTEHFPRVWDEIVHGLDTLDGEKAEREAHLLGRDFLEGRPLRDFLARLGPGGGFAVVPTPFAHPALVAWIDLPDVATRDLAAKMVHRAVSDAIKVRRDRGLPPRFEVAAEGSVWRVKIPNAPAWRLGEAFTPAYTFEKNRFVFSTCAAALASPAVREGGGHEAFSVEIGPLLDSVRSLAPFLADEAFRGEAERKAEALQLRSSSPGAAAALRKQFPDPADLAKQELAQMALFEARALEDLSKTAPYQDELARVKASIEAWSDGVSWIDHATGNGRFTSEGLVFELRAWPTQKR